MDDALSFLFNTQAESATTNGPTIWDLRISGVCSVFGYRLGWWFMRRVFGQVIEHQACVALLDLHIELPRPVSILPAHKDVASSPGRFTALQDDRRARHVVIEFTHLYNTAWLIERHGHRTPREARADAITTS